MKLRIALVVLACLLTSCSLGRFDRREAYLHAESVPRVKIPAKLDTPEFEDAMVIPPVNDSRDITGKPVHIGPPQSFSSSYGVDKIVIKKLGDTRWVFLDAPPATVWPKVREYWEDHHIRLADADPGKGIMETKWLYAKGGKPKAVFESIKNGVTEDDPGVTSLQKFRLQVEPGIRAGSTELYLKERSAPVGPPLREAVDWKGKSDNIDLEGVVLTDIAYYLGDHINATYAVSKGAEKIGVGTQKAKLIADPVKPVLRFQMQFDRAWATVGEALQNAKIDVDDLDRSAANYYVYFDEHHHGKPSWLQRLLFHGSESAKTPQNHYVIHLEVASDNVINVTVMKNQKTLANPQVAEDLLKVIKENST